MRNKEPKNIIPLTEPDGSEEINVNNLTPDLEGLDELTNQLSPEIAPGGFKKKQESVEISEPSIEQQKLKPLPTYEMDHLRNSLFSILINKQNDLIKEFQKSGQPITFFNVAGFKITIEVVP